MSQLICIFLLTLSEFPVKHPVMLAGQYAANTKCTAAGSVFEVCVRGQAVLDSQSSENTVLLHMESHNMLADERAFDGPSCVHAKPYHTTPGRSKWPCESCGSFLRGMLAWCLTLGAPCPCSAGTCKKPATLNLVVFSLSYMAHPNGCWHRLTFLLRLRPYSVRGHRLL